MNLSISYLEKIQESEKLTKIIKDVIEILLTAINDWPRPIMNLLDYENEIYKLIGEDVNKKKLEDYISKIDYSNNAWEAESLYQLMELYNYFDGEKSLKELLMEIQKKIEH